MHTKSFWNFIFLHYITFRKNTGCYSSHSPGGRHGVLKFETPKAWVQFCGLPNDLMREFPIIWVIGYILGAPRAVCNEHDAIYAILSDFGDRMTT